MMTITRITNIDNKKHVALLDTSSVSTGYICSYYFLANTETEIC